MAICCPFKAWAQGQDVRVLRLQGSGGYGASALEFGAELV